MEKLSNGIVIRLIVMIILMVSLGFGTFMWGLLPEMKKEIISLSKHQQLVLAKHIAEVINKGIEHDTRHLSVLGKEFNAKDLTNQKALDAWFEKEEGFARLFKYGLLLIDANGNVIRESTLVPERNKINFSDKKWFQDVKVSKYVVISKAFLARINKEPMIIIASPIKDKNGSFAGAIIVPKVLNETGFMGYIYNQKIGKSGGFLVISPKDKLFIASSKPEMVLKATPKKGLNKLHDKAMNGYRGTGITINVKGEEELSAIASIPSSGWFIVVRMLTDEVYEPIDTLLQKVYKAGFIVVFGLSIFIALTIFVVFKPLKKLSMQVRDIDPTKGQIQILEVNDKSNEIVYLTQGINTLIEAVNSYTKKLESLVRHDALTGVYNRRFFDEALQKIWNDRMRLKKEFSLIMIDIDFFKKYNDTYGHLKGDECLQKVAKCIEHTLKRSTDILCRYGGEEFVVIVDNSGERASLLAKTIRKNVEDLNLEHSASSFKRVTISLGVSSIIPSQNQTPGFLVKTSDEALYESKESGRNTVTFHL